MGFIFEIWNLLRKFLLLLHATQRDADQNGIAGL